MHRRAAAYLTCYIVTDKEDAFNQQVFSDVGRTIVWYIVRSCDWRAAAQHNIPSSNDSINARSQRAGVRFDASARVNKVGDALCSSSRLWGSPTKKFPMSIANVSMAARDRRHQEHALISGRLLASASISTTNVSCSFRSSTPSIDRPWTFFKGSLMAFTSLS